MIAVPGMGGSAKQFGEQYYGSTLCESQSVVKSSFVYHEYDFDEKFLQLQDIQINLYSSLPPNIIHPDNGHNKVYYMHTKCTFSTRK